MAEKQSRKEKAAEQRRAEILKAAGDIFMRKGYEATTMPEIAKSAGVAAGTIYLYFPSKRELFITVVKDIIITIPLLNLIGKIPTGNFDEVFKNIILERFDLLQNHGDAINRMPAFIGEIQRDPELKELWLKDFLQPFLSRMEMAYRMLNANGKARSIEPAVVVRMMGGMIFGFLMLKVMEGKSSPINKLAPEKVAEDILGFVLHGLMKGVRKTPQEKGRPQDGLGKRGFSNLIFMKKGARETPKDGKK